MTETRTIAELRRLLKPHAVILGYYWRDHGWLRRLIPNVHKVDNELYRSAHPGPRMLAKLKKQGLASILSLRGDAANTPNSIERVAASDLNLDLRFIRMRTATLPAPEVLLDLIAHLRDMPKPMLVHCKSGADRTGLAVTLYLHVLKGRPLDEARRALDWRYGHRASGRAGVVHALLDAYAADHAATGIGFEDWVRTRYDPDALAR